MLEPREAAERTGWSVGVLALTGTELPSACLEQCLNGDPSLAATKGCPMLKALLRKGTLGEEECSASARTDDRDEGPIIAPAVCEQGHRVTLLDKNQRGDPAVLILRPATDNDEALETAVEWVGAMRLQNWHLSQENDGLAEEVLRGYEQINLIFDISAQIANLTDAACVRRLLLTKIRDLFDADDVYLVSHDESAVTHVDRRGQFRYGRPGTAPPEHRDHDTVIELPVEYRLALGQLKTSPGVFVYSHDHVLQNSGHGTTMWGPSRDGAENFDVIGVVRRGKYFVAGDMLLLDSILTYGGHILGNLRLVEQLQQSSFEAVRAMVNAIDAKDSYTCGHSERVGFLAKVTGEAIGLPPEDLKQLEWAALLHDVGKIGIPETVLNKPGRLTIEEFALIKSHPSRGYEILRPVASLEPALAGVLYHHESPDGSGYPEGLGGQQIPLMARIVHVVDVFDALTSTRSYREAFDFERAIGILRQDAGTKLDSEVVETFIRTWRVLPGTHPEEYRHWFASQKEASP